MLFALKNMGHMVFTSQFSFLGNFKYHDKLEELEKAGRIRFVEDTVFYRFEGLNEPIGKYSKTPTKVYVYQKTEGDSLLAAQRLKK